MAAVRDTTHNPIARALPSLQFWNSLLIYPKLSDAIEGPLRNVYRHRKSKLLLSCVGVTGGSAGVRAADLEKRYGYSDDSKGLPEFRISL